MIFYAIYICLYVYMICGALGQTAVDGYTMSGGCCSTNRGGLWHDMNSDYDDGLFSETRGMTLSECKAACDNTLNGCVSFGFYTYHYNYGTWCRPSTRCTGSEGGCGSLRAYVYFYEKDLELTGYTMYQNLYCPGENDAKYWDLSLTECENKCNNLAGCISFEFFTKHTDNDQTLCQASATCLAQNATTLTTIPLLYFYEVDLDISGYIMHRYRYCAGQNAQILWDVTLSACAAACDDLEGCVSFEYFTQHPNQNQALCQPSTTCSYYDTSTDMSNGPLYFYQVIDFDGYKLRNNRYCPGKNDEKLWDVSLSDCVNACNDLSGCVSFEYFTQHPNRNQALCQPSTTCGYYDTGIDTNHGPLYFYEMIDFDGYLRKVKKRCSHYIEFLGYVVRDISLPECLVLCNSDISCQAFEYYYNYPTEGTKCKISTCSSPSVTDGASGLFYHYKRTSQAAIAPVFHHDGLVLNDSGLKFKHLILIIILIISFLIIVISSVYYCCRVVKKTKHLPVAMESDESDESDESHEKLIN